MYSAHNRQHIALNRLKEKKRIERLHGIALRWASGGISIESFKNAKGHLCMVERIHQAPRSSFTVAAQENVQVSVHFVPYQEAARDGLKRFLDAEKPSFPCPQHILNRHCGL